MRYATATALSGCLGLAAQAMRTLLFAQTAPSNEPSTQPVQAPPYRPGLGDLMTHARSASAHQNGACRRENNWTFAAYEHELDQSFERVAKYGPQWRRKPMADMMTTVTKDPMTALDRAIKAADPVQFATAYKALTDSCNTC